MLRLKNAVFSFIKNVNQLATPAEVVEALDLALRASQVTKDVHVLSVFFAGRPGLPVSYAVTFKNVFWHKDSPVVFRSGEYVRQIGKHGSLLHAFARLRSAPFTFAEARRRIRPTGNDQWQFELFRRAGVRDGLYCPFRYWMVLYWSSSRMDLPIEARALLTAAAQAAVTQIEGLVPRPMRNGPKPKREPSEREIHTLRLASHGKTAAEIATELELSVKTVRHHVEKVTRKLDAKNVTEAVAEAIRQGIIA